MTQGMTRSNHSRRDFLKGSAGAIAGAAAAGTLLSAAGGAYAASSDTVKVALIGCGGRGSGAARQALSTNGPVELVAVADAFEDNARRALQAIKAEKPDRVKVADDRVFSGFDAYKKAIDAGPDVVILATPPGFRPMHFEAAVNAGKHVFMEKPVSTDPAGVRKVLEAAEVAKQKNLKVGVGLQRHHSRRYIETVKRIQDGALGDLVLLRVYWNDAGVWVRPRQPQQTEMEYQMRNWYYFNWLCGDHINEQHIHNLDVANWVKNGHPVLARGMGGRQVLTGIDHGEIYDHHAVEYVYADGTTMLSECRHQPGCWSSVSEHAHGTKGYSDIGSGRLMSKYMGGEEIFRAPGDEGDPYQVEHDRLFDAIRNNKPHNEAEYGAHSTMTSILGRMATYSGLEVHWDDAINAQVSVMPERYEWDAKPPSTPNAEKRYSIPTPGVFAGDEVWQKVNAEIKKWADARRGGGGGQRGGGRGRRSGNRGGA
jgi:myo-inositol 2-dehydrogenase / D-chiro-inositol 1-dehydrogenase